MAKAKRFKVVPVKMYDVVDTEDAIAVFNTRDRDEAERYADEHERLYNPQGGDSEVH